MPKILSLNDMFDIIEQIAPLEADGFREALDNLGTEMAELIASHYGVATSGADTEPTSFAGTCANFMPARDGQDCPELIDIADPGGDWD